MSLKLKCGFLAALALVASAAWADTLELKNGSRINGKFLGGTDSEISFQVGSTVQKYDVADIASLKFDSEAAATAPAPQPQSSLPDNPMASAPVEMKPASATIPAGTRISVRTIDAIDSTITSWETASRLRSKNPSCSKASWSSRKMPSYMAG